ncbi:MAG: DJ-1/PfpI family protein [Candidatus Woesearchaeota archaeon]
MHTGRKDMKALFVIAQEGFQDHEYAAPKQILEDAGIEVITASKQIGRCKGSFGAITEAIVSLAEAKVAEYNVIIFIGGPGAVDYQHDQEAHHLVKEVVKENKLLAAICIAPTILAYAGVLKGKQATVWNGDGQQSKVLEKNGATYVNKPVVVDGKIITANGPPAAEEFGKKIVELLKH